MNKKFFLASGILGLLLIAWLLFSYSFVNVVIDNADGASEATYNITKQGSPSGKSKTSSKTNYKKLVRRGSYEATAAIGSRSGLVVLKAHGFLGTTTAHLNLKPANAMSFVGNNPSPCMYYTGKTLVSYECTDISGVNRHVEAVNDQPTYSQKIASFNDVAVLGVTKTSQGTVALVHQNIDSEDVESSIAVYLVDQDFNIINKTDLTGLSTDSTYSISKYKSGFLVHSSDGKVNNYYSSTTAKASPVNVGKPKNSELGELDFKVRGLAFATIYSNNNAGDEADLDGDHPKNVETEFVINDNGTEKHLTTTVFPSSSELCGDQKLCLIVDKNLKVYDYSGDSVKYDYQLSGVTSLATTDSTLLASKDNGLWVIDADQQTGYRSYSYGDNYTFCGQQPSSNGYSLCLINNKNNKVTLFIDLTKAKNSSIDQQVASLQQDSNVASISVYKNSIIISPNAGTLQYIASDKAYGYSPSALADATKQINKKIDQLGINRNTYTIKFTM